MNKGIQYPAGSTAVDRGGCPQGGMNERSRRAQMLHLNPGLALPHEHQTLERDFMENVIWRAREYGWKIYHTHDSRRSEEGFPDLIMIRGKRCVAAELKHLDQKPTLGQVRWLLAFSMIDGVEAYIWDESDMDAIIRLLHRDQ